MSLFIDVMLWKDILTILNLIFMWLDMSSTFNNPCSMKSILNGGLQSVITHCLAVIMILILNIKTTTNIRNPGLTMSSIWFWFTMNLKMKIENNENNFTVSWLHFYGWILSVTCMRLYQLYYHWWSANVLIIQFLISHSILF